MRSGGDVQAEEGDLRQEVLHGAVTPRSRPAGHQVRHQVQEVRAYLLSPVRASAKHCDASRSSYHFFFANKYDVFAWCLCFPCILISATFLAVVRERMHWKTRAKLSRGRGFNSESQLHTN